MQLISFRAAAIAALAMAAASPASAYVGPGAGLSAIGSALAFVGVILLMIVGLVWYPVKRLLRGSRSEQQDGEAPVDPAE